MPAPFQLIAAPFTAYYAPLGEAFPLVDAPIAGNWVMIGTSGADDMDEEGVTVQHSQEVNKVRGLGSTVPRKAFRTAEDLIIAFSLMDVSAEVYRLGVNSNEVTTVAAASGVAGTRTLQFYQGDQVATMALLLRAEVSPEGDGMNMQYEVPYCYMSANPEPTFKKGDAAMIDLEFTALKDPNAVSKALSFGRLVIQHQLPLA